MSTKYDNFKNEARTHSFLRIALGPLLFSKFLILPSTSVLVLLFSNQKKENHLLINFQTKNDRRFKFQRFFKGPDYKRLPFSTTVKTAPKYAAILLKEIFC